MSLSDILLTPLKRIPLAQGDVLHAMRQTDVGYSGFGEVYLTWINKASIKAWKRHSQMTMNIVVPVGGVRFVFHIEEAGEFRVEDIGIDRYMRLTVPPGIWFGFKGLAEPNSLVLNIANTPHDSSEVANLAIENINYEWN